MEDPGESVDEARYGSGRKIGGRNGLLAEEVVFAMRCEKFGEIGGTEGKEWNEEEWEARAGHIRRMELIRRATALHELSKASSIELFDVLANALTRNKAQLFPTRRWPKLRALEIADPATVEMWFKTSGIAIGGGLSQEQKTRAMNLFYTWRDIFETDLLRIRKTDLIEDAIVLSGDAKPYRAKIPLYS